MHYMPKYILLCVDLDVFIIVIIINLYVGVGGTVA